MKVVIRSLNNNSHDNNALIIQISTTTPPTTTTKQQRYQQQQQILDLKIPATLTSTLTAPRCPFNRAAQQAQVSAGNPNSS
jgi:hypothetical protein